MFGYLSTTRRYQESESGFTGLKDEQDWYREKMVVPLLPLASSLLFTPISPYVTLTIIVEINTADSAEKV